MGLPYHKCLRSECVRDKFNSDECAVCPESTAKYHAVRAHEFFVRDNVVDLEHTATDCHIRCMTLSLTSNGQVSVTTRPTCNCLVSFCVWSSRSDVRRLDAFAKTKGFPMESLTRRIGFCSRGFWLRDRHSHRQLACLSKNLPFRSKLV